MPRQRPRGASVKRSICLAAARFVEDAVERGLPAPTDAEVAASVGVEARDLVRLEVDLVGIRRHAAWLTQNRERFDRPPHALRKQVVSAQLAESGLVLEASPWVTRDDLERACDRGFTNALRHLDPASGLRLELLAHRTVRNAMLMEEWALAPPALRKPRNAVARSIKLAAARFVEDLFARRIAAPTEADVAAGLGVSIDDLARAEVDLEEIGLQAVWLEQNRISFDTPPHALRQKVIGAQLRRTLSRVFWIKNPDLSGALGFETALRKFDPNKNLPFEPYAHTIVGNHLLAEANATFPRSVQKTLEKISRAEKTARGKEGREPTIDELVDETGLTRETIEQAWRAASVLRPEQFPAYERAEFDNRAGSSDSGHYETTSESDAVAAETLDVSDGLGVTAGPSVSTDSDAGERIERGISGPRERPASQVELRTIEEALERLPRGQVEVCHWLEGTWDYLARTSRRVPSTEELAAAVGLSPGTVKAACNVMAGLISRRTIPPLDPDAPESLDSRQLPQELAEAYESLPSTERAIIDWEHLDGPVPCKIVKIALRTARTRVRSAVTAAEDGEPSKADRAIADWIAESVRVTLQIDFARTTNEVEERETIRRLVKRAVKSYLGLDIGPVTPEEEAAIEILKHAINNTIKQRVKKANDLFTDRAIANVVELNVTPPQHDALIARYRAGRHRLDLTGQDLTSYRDLYCTLRQRLSYNTLLTRMFTRGELKVLDSRYRSATPVPVHDLAANGWSVNRCLALEFETMQQIVAVIAPLGRPHQKKRELPHALLPEQLKIADLHFRRGLTPSGVAAQLGEKVPVRQVEQALWDILETQRWLFDDGRSAGEGNRAQSRYLNLGPYQPAPPGARQELKRVCELGNNWKTAAPGMTPLARTAICSILGLGRSSVGD